MWRIKISVIAVAGILFLAISAAAFAQRDDKGRKIIKRASGEISGEISAIGRDFISVIYKRDEKKGAEYEVLVPIDAGTKLERKRSLSELNLGDTVNIQFEDMTLEDAGREKNMERKAKVISFVRPAVRKPEPPRPPEPGDGLPDD